MVPYPTAKHMAQKERFTRTIRPGKSGQVQVEFQDALRTCEAVAEDETLTIDTGKFILVTGNIAETLVVKPLKISDALAEEE